MAYGAHLLRHGLRNRMSDRKLVPKMMAILAAKQKKYDEEAVKRKRKLEESRAKAKLLRQKKAAAAEERAAERVALARRSAWEKEALQEDVSRQAAELMSAEAAVVRKELAATPAAPEDCTGLLNIQQRASGLEVVSTKEGRGDGGTGTAASGGAEPIGSTGGAGWYGPHHHPHPAPQTPGIGRLGIVPTIKGGWRASGDDGTVGVGSRPSMCGVAEDAAVWVAATSAAAKEHHGTAAESSRVMAGRTDSSNHSSFLAPPGGALPNAPSKPHGASFSLSSSSHSTRKYSEQRKTIQSRHTGGKRDANSGSALQLAAVDSSEPSWGVDVSTESLWGLGGPLPNSASTFREARGSSEALTVLPTAQTCKAGGRWGSLRSTEGTWAAASAAAAVALAAEAREEAARGMLPAESNVGGRRCFNGDDGAGGVEHSPCDGSDGDYSLRHVRSSSGSSTQGTVGGGSFFGIGSSIVAASTCDQTIGSQATPRSTMAVSSSGRQIPLSRRPLSPSLSRAVPHHRPPSSAAQSPLSLRHVSSLPRANLRQQPPKLSPPQTFRGVSMLAEALTHGRPETAPTSPPVSLAPRLQLVGGKGTVSGTTTSHSGWVDDMCCSAADSIEGSECVGENRVGVELLASAGVRQQQQQPQHEGKGLPGGDDGAAT